MTPATTYRRRLRARRLGRVDPAAEMHARAIRLVIDAFPGSVVVEDRPSPADHRPGWAPGSNGWPEGDPAGDPGKPNGSRQAELFTSCERSPTTNTSTVHRHGKDSTMRPTTRTTAALTERMAPR